MAIPSLGRRVAAEFLGTLVLVGTVIGSGIMGETLSTDAAVALLGNTIATAAILYVLIGALGPISDAHFNPVVTLAFWIRGEGKASKAADALWYLAAQFSGGYAGTLTAHLFFEDAASVIGVKPRTGWAIWSSEAAATFMLLGTILSFAKHKRDADIPIAVAMVITAGYWWTSATSFANPAVAFARGFTDTFAGIRLIDVPGFWVCEFIGTVAALAVWGFILDDFPATSPCQCVSGPDATPQDDDRGSPSSAKSSGSELAGGASRTALAPASDASRV
jgi:glycerol uptake facilitator-like aquaporin